MSKKPVAKEEFIKQIPAHKEGLGWSQDANGKVTLEMENKGIANRIAQLLLRKPKISYIHLDEMGSVVWPLIDGVRDIETIGTLVKETCGEKAEPLYERLSQYMGTLSHYGFLTWGASKKGTDRRKREG